MKRGAWVDFVGFMGACRPKLSKSKAPTFRTLYNKANITNRVKAV